MEGAPSLGPTPEQVAPVPPEKPLGMSSSFVYIVSLVSQLIGYVSSFEIAKHVSTSAAGFALWGFIQFNLLLASSVNSLGELRLGSAFVYYMGRDRSYTRYTGTYFLARTGFVVVSGIALLLLAPEIGLTVAPSSLSTSTIALYSSIAIFMALPILWTPSTVYTQLHVGMGDSIRAQYPTLVESIVRTAALVAAAFLFPTVGTHVDADAIWALTGAYVLGASASAIVSLRSVWTHFSRFRMPDLRHLLAYAWPLIGSMGLLYAVTNALPILARAFYQTEAVAVLSASNGFRVLLLALAAAVVVPLFPHLAGLHSRGEGAALRDRIWRALRYTSMMVVPGAVLFVVYRSTLLGILFNNTYATGFDLSTHSYLPGGGGAVPLALLALSAVPLSLSQIIGTSLNAVGQQRLELYLTLTQVAVLFGSAFWFIHSGGVLGFTGLAALSFSALLSSIAALILNAYFLYRLVRVPVRWRPAVTILVAAAAEFLVMSRFNAVVTVNRWYELVGIGLIALAVYVGVLIAVGELSREDVRLMLGSVGLPPGFTNAVAKVCWRESYDGTAIPASRPPPSP